MADRSIYSHKSNHVNLVLVVSLSNYIMVGNKLRQLIQADFSTRGGNIEIWVILCDNCYWPLWLIRVYICLFKYHFNLAMS